MMSSLYHTCVRYCVYVSLDRQTERTKHLQGNDSAKVWEVKWLLTLALCLQAGSPRERSNILRKAITGDKLFCVILRAGKNKGFQFDCWIEQLEKDPQFRWK